MLRGPIVGTTFDRVLLEKLFGARDDRERPTMSFCSLGSPARLAGDPVLSATVFMESPSSPPSSQARAQSSTV